MVIEGKSEAGETDQIQLRVGRHMQDSNKSSVRVHAVSHT
jgi:hypothetical protein